MTPKPDTPSCPPSPDKPSGPSLPPMPDMPAVPDIVPAVERLPIPDMAPAGAAFCPPCTADFPAELDMAFICAGTGTAKNARMRLLKRRNPMTYDMNFILSSSGRPPDWNRRTADSPCDLSRRKASSHSPRCPEPHG